MNNAHPFVLNRLVLFTPHRDQNLDSLTHELQALGITTEIFTDLTNGLHLLYQLAPDRCAKTAVLILKPLGKLSVCAIAQAIRSLPNCTALPLIALESLPQKLTHCRHLDTPLNGDVLAQLLTTQPSGWTCQPDRTVQHLANGTSSGHILAVDDSPVNLRMLRLQTESLGFEVETCEDGEQAVARISTGGIRLVLMDCHMPIMDGYEATAIIRQQEVHTHQHLPIIAVTANAMLSNRERCFSIGMDAFLLKPVNLEQLRQALNQWLPKS